MEHSISPLSFFALFSILRNREKFISSYSNVFEIASNTKPPSDTYTFLPFIKTAAVPIFDETIEPDSIDFNKSNITLSLSQRKIEIETLPRLYQSCEEADIKTVDVRDIYVIDDKGNIEYFSEALSKADAIDILRALSASGEPQSKDKEENKRDEQSRQDITEETETENEKEINEWQK